MGWLYLQCFVFVLHKIPIKYVGAWCRKDQGVWMLCKALELTVSGTAPTTTPHYAAAVYVRLRRPSRCALFAFWEYLTVWWIPHVSTLSSQTLQTEVLLETLIIFLLDFLEAHLLFGYPGIWLPSLFLEPSPRVKQAAGLTCKSPRGGSGRRMSGECGASTP